MTDAPAAVKCNRKTAVNNIQHIGKSDYIRASPDGVVNERFPQIIIGWQQFT
mgnify:CR=1 FL=1